MVSGFIRGHIAGWTAAFHSLRCTIEQEQKATGPYGESLNVWVVVAADVPCRVITAGINTQSKADPVGDAESITEQYRLSVPAGTPLAAGQRVTVGTDVYQVVSLLVARTDENERQAVITAYD